MKMLRNLFIALMCLIPMVAMAQGEVKWSHSVTEKGNGNYTVQLKAQIEEGWHIYVNDPAKAFNPTEIVFKPGEGVTIEGNLRTLSSAISSISTARTLSAPNFAATIAKTPVPLPISSTRLPATSPSSRASIINCVVQWWPVPKDIFGWMITSNPL